MGLLPLKFVSNGFHFVIIHFHFKNNDNETEEDDSNKDSKEDEKDDDKEVENVKDGGEDDDGGDEEDNENNNVEEQEEDENGVKYDEDNDHHASALSHSHPNYEKGGEICCHPLVAFWSRGPPENDCCFCNSASTRMTSKINYKLINAN